MRSLLALILVALGLAVPVEAQVLDDPALQDLVRRLDRNALFTECDQVSLLVRVDGGAVDMGLTVERVRITAESRLREPPRLYLDNRLEPAQSTLYGALLVTVETSGPAFMASAKFMKHLYDPVTDDLVRHGTWERRRLGTHGGRSDPIVQGLSDMVNEFVLEYLRVNEASC